MIIVLVHKNKWPNENLFSSVETERGMIKYSYHLYNFFISHQKVFVLDCDFASVLVICITCIYKFIYSPPGNVISNAMR